MRNAVSPLSAAACAGAVCARLTSNAANIVSPAARAFSMTIGSPAILEEACIDCPDYSNPCAGTLARRTWLICLLTVRPGTKQRPMFAAHLGELHKRLPCDILVLAQYRRTSRPCIGLILRGIIWSHL